MNSVKSISVGIAIALVSLFKVFSAYGSCCNMTAKLDSYVQTYVDQGLFSGAVLVAKDGKVLLCKGYGMANLELKVPNTPETKFRIGSITKPFTAMAILQLKEMGLLSVNDSLSKYIPDYPNGETITIEHLLMHTSGIPHSIPAAEYKKFKIKPHTLEERIALFKNIPLRFKPGEKELYSDSGYILLTYIIEKVSGKNYESFIQEHIFDPAGMKDSGYDSYKCIIKNRAAGYSVVGELVNADYVDMSYEAGAGALYSTVQDLFLWNQALSTNKLISQKSLALIEAKKDSHGLGWGTKYTGGYKWGTHGGLVSGFISFFGRGINNDVCIIVLSNFEHVPLLKMVENLERIVYGQAVEYPKKRVPIALNPKVYDQYIGGYMTKDAETMFIVTKERNKLFIQEVGDVNYEVYPISETEFFIKPMDVYYTFVKDGSGNVVQLVERGTIAQKTANKIVSTTTWKRSIDEMFAVKKSGKFEAKDRMGAPVILEWLKTSIHEPTYTPTMHMLEDLVVQAFGPIELQQLRVHPEKVLSAKKGDLLEPLQILFKRGARKIDWKLVEEKLGIIERVAWQSVAEKLENFSLFFVIAKDPITTKMLGFICYRMAPDASEGSIEIEPLAVAPEEQKRGLGKLLISSIFKIIPGITGLWLGTSATNTGAIAAYTAMGFAKMHTDPNNVVFLYLTGKSDILQKTARTFIER